MVEHAIRGAFFRGHGLSLDDGPHGAIFHPPYKRSCVFGRIFGFCLFHTATKHGISRCRAHIRPPLDRGGVGVLFLFSFLWAGSAVDETLYLAGHLFLFPVSLSSGLFFPFESLGTHRKGQCHEHFPRRIRLSLVLPVLLWCGDNRQSMHVGNVVENRCSRRRVKERDSS